MLSDFSTDAQRECAAGLDHHEALLRSGLFSFEICAAAFAIEVADLASLQLPPVGKVL